MVTHEERVEIAMEVVSALQKMEYCNTCKMQSDEHRQDHEYIHEIKPSLDKMNAFLDKVDKTTWSLVKWLIMAAIVAVLGWFGVHVGSSL